MESTKRQILRPLVLDVSPDDAQSHTQFIDQYRLPFTLLSDPDKTMMSKYGAYGEKMMYGKKTIGIIRSTVWIGADGKVKKHWRKVPNVVAHPAKVLQVLHEQKSFTKNPPEFDG